MPRDAYPTVDAPVTAQHEWLLLICQVPSEPARLRAAVWRRLTRLGAVHIHQSIAALPPGATTEEALRAARREIRDLGGSAVLLSCTVLAGEAQLRADFQDARAAKYAQIGAKCRELLSRFEGQARGERSARAAASEFERDLARLRGRLAQITGRDTFGEPQRGAAFEALRSCEQALQQYREHMRIHQGDGRGGGEAMLGASEGSSQ